MEIENQDEDPAVVRSLLLSGLFYDLERPSLGPVQTQVVDNPMNGLLHVFGDT